MRLGDTILACCSPPGRSARAVVRISGPGAQGAVRARLRSPWPAGRGVVAGRFALQGAAGGGGELPVLLAWFPGPGSYTGEDVAELQVPGGPAVVARVVQVMLAGPGVRHAEAGEFSARAYLHGRLTLEQAEGVAATIAAQTRGQLESARRLLAGEAGAAYRRWAERLAGLLALVEAGIDFTDQEDVVAIAPGTLAAGLRGLLAEIAGHLGGPAGSESHTGRPRVVLAGAPNAGKSTLFNALLGRRRSVVSAEAGTTRDVIVEVLDLSRDVPGAGEVELVDVAGLEEGTVGVGAAAQAAAGRAVEAAAVVVHCDPSGRFEVSGLPSGGHVLRVRTKADAGVAGEGLPVCALDGWGLPELRRRLAAAAWGSLDQVLVAAPRHRRCLGAAAASLEAALACFDDGARTLAAAEVVAGELRLALDRLGEVSGQIAPDDVLGRIFAGFCVGK